MAGVKAKTYAERVIARARELKESDAFEAVRRSDVMAVSAKEAKADARADNRSSRRLVVVFALISAAIAGFSLLLPYVGIDSMGIGGAVYSPQTVLDCYALWFQLNVMPLFDPTLGNRAATTVSAFLETHDALVYSFVINRAQITVIVIMCGILLATSGLLFQTAFRNPLAAPSSLGVSDGVTLGCVIFTLMGYSSIYEAPELYLQLVYGLGALVVIVVLLGSRLFSGGARYNVLDMLLLGTVACQLVGGFNGYVQNFVMDYDAWESFYDVQQAADALKEPLVQAVVVAVFLITFVPALVLRFRLNLIAFSDDDGKMMGARAGILRGFALVLGSVMQLAALASIGQVAMLSLAVPFVVRYAMPADFRSQFLGNCLMGTAVLLVCVAIQHFATVGIVTMPVGTIVSIFIVPFFVWMVAFGKGRW